MKINNAYIPLEKKIILSDKRIFDFHKYFSIGNEGVNCVSRTSFLTLLDVSSPSLYTPIIELKGGKR